MEGKKLMIQTLAQINGYDLSIPDVVTKQEDMVRQLMTVSKPCVLSEAYYLAEKEFIRNEKANKVILDVADIEDQLTPNIYICRNDITQIRGDVIVNAANEFLLGCFIPGHRCIDNAIHMSAGLGLRNACHDQMKQSEPEDMVGEAKITKGFNLPSDYVVHTVGPNLNSDNPPTFEEAKKALAKCYRSCLKLVNGYEDISNIVFCSISTGIYGFPIQEASKIALDTIETYLATQEHHLTKVIIDVFSKEDYDVYKESANNRINKK